MIAADIMTHPVLAIGPDTPLVQAIRLMTSNKVSGLPVVGPDGQILGILTEGDLMRRVETGTQGEQPGWLTRFLLPGREAGNYVATHGRLVSELMTSEVCTVVEGTPLQDVVALMRRHGVKRVPVLRDGRLLGIVTRADLVRRVGESLEAQESTASLDDGAIQRAIVNAMDREPWAPGNMVTVAVKDGVVELDGCIFDLRERDAMGVLAENMRGVIRVENRIVCVEPYAGMVIYDPAAPT